MKYYHKQTKLSNQNLVNSKPNLIIFLFMLYKVINITLEMLTICSGREFYKIKEMFFFSSFFLPRCEAMTSQQRDWSVAMLMQHYCDDAGTTPIQIT